MPVSKRHGCRLSVFIRIAGAVIFHVAIHGPLAFAVTANEALQFVRERLWIRLPLNPASADLREELDFEINRMLDKYDSGGHLQPALFSIGITGVWLLYGYPGEQAYILADALPFLPTSTQARVKAYLYNEIRQYDPTIIGFEHCGSSGWGSCEMAGNRREFFSIPTSPNPEPLVVNIWPPASVPPEGLYMIWRYCDATADWGFISTNNPPSGDRWNRMLGMFNSISNPPTRYGHIAAAIGMARICMHFGITNGHPYTTALARVRSGMLAGTNFDAFVQTSYNQFLAGNHDWAWTPFHYTRHGPVGAMMAPEIGRFLREYALTSVYRRVTFNPLAGQSGQPYAIEDIWQGWYLTRGHYIPLIPIMGYYGENHMVTPDTPWALFMTHAWVYNESGEELRRWLDAPYCIGDLFHIQRLTATIAAYGEPVWSDVTPPLMTRISPTSGGLAVEAVGGSGRYFVEASADLTAWSSLATNSGPAIIITNPAGPPVQFFRSRVAP